MALTVTVSISDADELALKNDLMDIDEWVQKAVTGKINNCKKRMLQAGTAGLLKDPDFTGPIPSSEDALIALIATRTDDRKTREAATTKDV